MNIGDSERNGVLVATVNAQRIDAAVAPDFKEALARIVCSPGKRNVIDLGQVTFIDSTGLGALVALLKMPNGPRELAIAGAKGQVETLFRLTRMNKVFRMFGTVDEAVTDMGHGRGVT
jgi:anti-sigma B factor antagonist